MKFRLLTALWGSEFCELFLRTTARSLLAAGNFPDLAQRYDTTYTIITTDADANSIRSNPVFQALAASGKVELQTIDESEIDPRNPSSHWIIWRKGVQAAKENGQYVVYIMPDVVYASGTLSEWASAFERGFRAVFTSVPEVVLETTLRELEGRCAPERHLELNLSVRETTDLFLKHIHPYHICMLRGSRRWLVHPEFVGYVVPGLAFVQRIMGSHPFCFDPAFFDFNDAFTPLNNLDRIAFLPCTAISLEPLLKFMSHYYRSWTMTEDRLSGFGWWFDRFAVEANDLESRRSYVFPLPGRWCATALARVHARGNFYRAQCLATRMVFRVWTSLGELGCRRAAELVATAHYAARLRRHMLLARPTTILVPSDQIIDRAGRFVADGIAKRERALLDRIRDQCFAGRYALKVGQRVRTTAEGGIDNATGYSPVDGEGVGTILSGPVELDEITIYVTDFLATPRSGRGKRAVARADRPKAERRAFAEPELLVVHPTLVERGARERFDPESGSRPTAITNIEDYRYLAGPLGKLAKASVAPEPADGGVAYGILPALRGHIATIRILLGMPSIYGSGRDSLKKSIRKRLLAGGFGKADAAASAAVWRELAGQLIPAGHLALGLHCRRKAVACDPGNAELRQELLYELLVAGRLEEANAADGRQIQLWRRLGGAFITQGHLELGLYCRRRAVELDPGSLQLRKELVRELLLSGRMEEADAEGGGLQQLWRELGDELGGQGRSDLARHCRCRALQVKPDDVSDASIKLFRDLQIEIGLVALRGLLSGYSEEIGASPRPGREHDASPLAYLEQYLEAHGLGLDPVRDLIRLLRQEPDFAEAWLEKAFWHWEAGELAPAVEAALRASRATPRCIRSGYNPHPHAEAAELTARCFEQAGLHEAAIKAYRKSLSLDEDQPSLRVRLGHLLWRQGSIDEAITEFAKGMAFGYRLANLPALPRRLEKLSLSLDLGERGAL